MKAGKVNFFLFILFILFIFTISFAEEINNENINSLPSTFEELNEQDEILETEENENFKLNDEIIKNYIDPTVEIKVLDKITTKITNLKIKIGEEKIFKNLKIKPLNCKISEFDDSPDTIIYLQVVDIKQQNKDKVFIFNGWTFSSSPSFQPFDHPIYDLWLIGCHNI